MAVVGRVRGLVRAIRENDAAAVEDAVLRLSRSRRWLAPLALGVGAVVMLYDGVKLVFSNWRLTLIQILPAMWIWLAMFDLKFHVLHGKAFIVRHGFVAVVLVAAITAISAAAFFLNAVFAFAIAEPGQPQIRPAFARAWAHRRVVLGCGAIVGVCLGFSTIVVTRWGRPWFALSLSVVIGVMMICYVGVPARLIGVRPTQSRRDKLAASALSGTLGAAVCTPPYVLGRVGILMLGSPSLLIPGIILLTIGFALEAGATGAVKAVKMSAKLIAANPSTSTGASLGDPAEAPARVE